MPIVQIIENYYIVECAGVRAIAPDLQLVQKLWLTLLQCGMCQVQAIVAILRLVQKLWLTLLHCGMCRVQAIVRILQLVQKLWLTLLTTVPIHHRHGHSGLYPATFHNMISTHRSEHEVHKLLQEQVSSRGATTHSQALAES
jgi:hypothetical protein